LIDVIPAAYHGRVRFLFIADNIQYWGRYEKDNDNVTVHSPARPDDDDLMDLAVNMTLKHAGSVYVLKPEEVPGNVPVSAVLRF
jgi:hypothetical protein